MILQLPIFVKINIKAPKIINNLEDSISDSDTDEENVNKSEYNPINWGESVGITQWGGQGAANADYETNRKSNSWRQAQIGGTGDSDDNIGDEDYRMDWENSDWLEKW